MTRNEIRMAIKLELKSIARNGRLIDQCKREMHKSRRAVTTLRRQLHAMDMQAQAQLNARLSRKTKKRLRRERRQRAMEEANGTLQGA